MKKIILFLLPLLFFCEITYGRTQISLLTSTACDNAIYTVWGHSAIRVYNEKEDHVYNYGVFSFGEGFIYNFITGQTDYKVDRDYSVLSSIRSANRKNVYLYEQLLNVTEEEANEIALNLELNALPENCYYRYNFFYDNCATRPRKMIEKSISDIQYPIFNNTKTYRDIIYELTATLPWYTLAIDYCMGSPTDQVVSDSLMMFLPLELNKALSQATRKDSLGNNVPVVKYEHTLVTPSEEKTFENQLHPTWVITIAALILAILIIVGYKRWDQRVLDIVLFALFGILGSLIFFLNFFSEHPCVSPNFNLLWSNPLQLLFAILVPIKGFKKIGIKYQYFNLTTIVLAFIIGVTHIQVLNPAFYPAIAILAMQSISYILRKGEKKANKSK